MKVYKEKLANILDEVLMFPLVLELTVSLAWVVAMHLSVDVLIYFQA